ncbi:FKBP-type peptidyl-prolyl cis-trans isomerase [Flavobacterium olei]|uniref:FKBP-type peptidyl-prolyl cis-trans isomerase n=1 Tax=Flavobacterium olei TaxID=1886782 RepID=UPI00321BD919
MKHVFTALLVMTLFISCSNDTTLERIDTTDYSAKNDKEIQDYLTKNNLTATKTSSGLCYIINEQGTGQNPTTSSTVTVVYKGTLTNGTVFDQSAAGATFPLNKLILGWQEGLPKFKEGGSGILLIPSRLGYGNTKVQNIPSGSVLIFEIKLTKVAN